MNKNLTSAIVLFILCIVTGLIASFIQEVGLFFGVVGIITGVISVTSFISFLVE